VKRPNAYPLYLAMVAVHSLAFTTAYVVAGVYYILSVGLNPLQLVLVGTVLEGTYFLFEVPTGVVADTYSRRLSVIIGLLTVGVAVVFEGLLPLFAALLLAEAVRGVGETFMSGAWEAWIADEVGEERAGNVFIRGSQVSQAAGLLGIGLGTGLATIRLNLPLVVGGAITVALGLALIFLMPERGFHPTPREERNSWRAMGDTFHEGLRVARHRPFVASILGIGLVFGAFSEGFDRLSEAHFLRDLSFPLLGNLQPVVWFGMMSAATMLLSLPASELARRKVNTRNPAAVARALFAANALLSAGVIAFALAGSFWIALLTYLAASVLRQVQDPLYTTWLNQHVDSSMRATVISMGGQANALGQIAGGPGIGAVGAAVSLRAALALSGVLLTPALALYGRVLRRRHSRSG